MTFKTLHKIFVIIAFLTSATLTSECDMQAYAQTGNSQKSASRQRSRKKTSGKKTSSRNSQDRKNRNESSADVRKREQAAQAELRQTKEQLRKNEASIKKNLNALGKLEDDMKVTRGQIDATTGQIVVLDKKIGGLQSGIVANEKELARMRTEYLKAVKKMRTARKNTSALAFIFASDNFNQALRRIRYLRQFSRWKDRQTAAINGKTAQLREQSTQLEKTRGEKNVALRNQKSAEAKLKRQHASQDAIVAELRKNGEALSAHLAKKQAEVNQLRSRVSALIAEEERAAAAERARVEAEKKAQAEKAAAEERERRRIEAERQERERQLAMAEEKAAAERKASGKNVTEKNDAKAAASDKKTKETRQQTAKTSDKTEKNLASRSDSPKPEKKKDKKKKTKPETKNNGNYADARRRRPRDKWEQASAPAVATGDFASMRGNLPKPAGGSFRVTSRYGRQSFPDLPDVTFDNTGIDAEVSSGASALAVYPGRVSKMVRLDGYGTVIIVNHGNYYTVYGNLAAPAVRIGDMVKAGQALGTIAADEDDPSHGSIHFEVWKNKERMNPLDWIRL